MVSSVLGWAALVFLVLAELNHAAKQIIKKRKRTVKIWRLLTGRQHRVWGYILFLIGFLHGILALVALTAPAPLIIGSGCALFLCVMLLTVTYLARRKLTHWLPYHKRLAAVSFVLAVLHTILVHT